MSGQRLKILFNDFINSHKNYKLVDIVINYYGVIKSAHIGLILMTEKEKENFYINNYNQCVEELSKKLNENNIIEICNFKYEVFSKEVIDKEYNGNYYYAMH